MIRMTGGKAGGTVHVHTNGEIATHFPQLPVARIWLRRPAMDSPNSFLNVLSPPYCLLVAPCDIIPASCRVTPTRFTFAVVRLAFAQYLQRHQTTDKSPPPLPRLFCLYRHMQQAITGCSLCRKFARANVDLQGLMDQAWLRQRGIAFGPPFDEFVFGNAIL